MQVSECTVRKPRPHKQDGVRIPASQNVSVDLLEGGAPHDQALAVCQVTVYDAGQLVQPWPSVGVIQRDAAPHLVCAAAMALPQMETTTDAEMNTRHIITASAQQLAAFLGTTGHYAPNPERCSGSLALIETFCAVYGGRSKDGKEGKDAAHPRWL